MTRLCFPGLPGPQQAASPPPPRAGMREGPLSGAVAPKHRLVLETAWLLQCRLRISQDASVSVETAAEPATAVLGLPPSSPLLPRAGPYCPGPAHILHTTPFPGWLCSAFCFLTCSPSGRGWGSGLGRFSDLPGPFTLWGCDSTRYSLPVGLGPAFASTSYCLRAPAGGWEATHSYALPRSGDCGWCSVSMRGTPGTQLCGSLPAAPQPRVHSPPGNGHPVSQPGNNPTQRLEPRRGWKQERTALSASSPALG